MAELFPLAACPFCGTECQFHIVPDDGSPYSGGDYVECGNVRCGATSALIKMANHDLARTKLVERWNLRTHQDDAPPRPAPEAPRFPAKLQRTWTGTEVQEWIDRNWERA